MPDIVFSPGFDDSDLERALQNLERGIEKTSKEIDDLGARATKAMKETADSVETVEDQMNSMTKEALENARAMDKVADSQEKATKSSSTLRKGVTDLIRDVRIGGRSVGEYVDTVEKYTQASSKAGKESGKLGKRTRGLGGAMKFLKVSVPLAILGALVKALQSSDKAMKFFERSTKAVSAGWKTLVKNIENGDFKGLGRDVLSAAQAAFEATKRFQELEVLIRRLSVQESEFADVNFQLQQILEDQTRAYELRAFAARQITDNELSVLGERFQQEEQLLRIFQAQSRSADEIAEQEIKTNRARTAFREAQVRGVRRLAQLDQERITRIETEQKRIQNLQKEYDRLTKSLEDQANAARLSVLNQLDRLFAERDQAIQEVQKLRQEIIDFAQNEGLAIPDNLDENVAAIVEAINTEFKKQVRQLQEEGEDPWSQILSPVGDADFLDAAVRENVLGVAESIGAAAQDSGIVEKFQAFKQSILDAFGLSEQEAAFVADSFASVFDSIQLIGQANLEFEIEQQERIIEARSERVKSLERDLDKEKQLQEDGLANNVSALEQALKEEEAVIRAAEQKRLDLEREVAQKRLVADSIQQASQLSLAAAKVISSEAGKGLPGILLAATGIALLFSIIAKAKAQAKQFSAIPKFREGTKFEGPSHEQGGIPLLVGSPQGYRAIEVEGGEHLIGTAPSLEHDQFLTALNNRKYDGLPLYELAEAARRSKVVPFAKSVQSQSYSFVEARERRNFESMENVFREEIRSMKGDILKMLGKMPVAYDPNKDVAFRFPNTEKQISRK